MSIDIIVIYTTATGKLCRYPEHRLQLQQRWFYLGMVWRSDIINKFEVTVTPATKRNMPDKCFRMSNYCGNMAISVNQPDASTHSLVQQPYVQVLRWFNSSYPTNNFWSTGKLVNHYCEVSGIYTVAIWHLVGVISRGHYYKCYSRSKYCQHLQNQVHVTELINYRYRVWETTLIGQNLLGFCQGNPAIHHF